eukprot:499307_1
MNEACKPINYNRLERVVGLISKSSRLHESTRKCIINTERFVTKLVLVLKCDYSIDHDDHLQYHAMSIFRNICQLGTKEQKQYVIDIGGIPLFIYLLKLGHKLESINTTHRHVIETLGEMANLNSNLVLENNMLEYLLPICKNCLRLKPIHSTNIVTFLNNIIFNDLIDKEFHGSTLRYVEQIIECSFYLLKINDSETLLINTETIIEMMCKKSSADIMIYTSITNIELMHALVNILDHESADVRREMLCRFPLIPIMWMEISIKCDLLKKLSYLLKKCTISVDERYYICHCIRGICDKKIDYKYNKKEQFTKENIAEQVVKSNVFPLLLFATQNVNSSLADEAFFAISNAICWSRNEEISHMVNAKLINIIIFYVKPDNINDHFVSIEIKFAALKCLEIISNNVKINRMDKYENYIQTCVSAKFLNNMQLTFLKFTNGKCNALAINDLQSQLNFLKISDIRTDNTTDNILYYCQQYVETISNILQYWGYEVKSSHLKDTFIVFGYIKRCQNELFQNNIPPLCIHILFKYYHIPNIKQPFCYRQRYEYFEKLREDRYFIYKAYDKQTG